jgi:hypothetical protein
VKDPAGGRPRLDQVGPIFFCTCCPSGSRNFAYHTAPRERSTLNTCPDGGINPGELMSRRVPEARDILGTHHHINGSLGSQKVVITGTFAKPAFGIEPKTSSLQVKCSAN